MLQRLLHELCSRVSAALHRRRHDDEFRDELASHLQMMIEERVAKGMNEQDARRESLLKLGGISQLEEAHREWRGLPLLDIIRRDFGHAFRTLRRDRRFVAAILAVVTLGAGVSTAAVTVVRQAFFRPLPFTDEGRLVSIGITLPWMQQEFLFGRAYAQLHDELASGALPFAGVTSMTGVQDCEADAADGRRKRLACAHVESSFLSILGVRPEAGRDFTEADDQPGSPPVLLVTHAFWTAQFGADIAAIGRTVQLDGTPARIAGVLPRTFELPAGEHADMLVPQRVSLSSQRSANPGRPFHVIARLSDETHPVAAAIAMRTLLATGSGPSEVQRDIGFRVRSLRDLRFRDAKLASWLLMGSAASMFLITCTNAAFLLLARAATRRRESVIRLALGAQQSTLIRQSLAETLLVAVPGGVAGYLLAYLILRLFTGIVPASLVPATHIQMDDDAFLICLTLAVAAGIIISLLPLLADSTRLRWNGEQSSTGAFRNSRLRQTLVVSQLALCIVLLSGTATLLRTLWSLRSESTASMPDRIVTASFILSRDRYSNVDAQKAFFSHLEHRLRSARIFDAVALSDSLPPFGPARSQAIVALASDPNREGAHNHNGGRVVWRFVTPDYLTAMRIPILQGRTFTNEDVTGPPVVVISAALARQLFSSQDAIGRTMSVSGVPAVIIGVAEDVRNGSPGGEPEPEYYALRQEAAGPVYNNQEPRHGWRRASVVVRTSLPAHTAKSILREHIDHIAPGMDIRLETLAERFDALAERPRFQVSVLGAFGLASLLLATIGLYGLVAYMARERMRELAVRIALGASAADVLRLVLGIGLRWAALGAAAGVVLSFSAVRALRTASHEMVGIDFASLATSVLVLCTACAVSAWRPARQAIRIDPSETLRMT